MNAHPRRALHAGLRGREGVYRKTAAHRPELVALGSAAFTRGAVVIAQRKQRRLLLLPCRLRSAQRQKVAPEILAAVASAADSALLFDWCWGNNIPLRQGEDFRRSSRSVFTPELMGVEQENVSRLEGRASLPPPSLRRSEAASASRRQVGEAPSFFPSPSGPGSHRASAMGSRRGQGEGAAAIG